MRPLITESENHRTMGDAIAKSMRELGLDSETSHTFHYFFYVADRCIAELLAARLTVDGLMTEIDPGGDDEDCLCFVSHTTKFVASDFNRRGEFFLRLAAEVGGVFDGWEIAIEDQRSDAEILSILQHTPFLVSKKSM